jgi:serine/threonine-protein kinase
MSKQKKTPAAPPDPYPSAAVLRRLTELKGKRLPREVGVREVWIHVVQAAAHSDFPVVADFALENEWIVPLADSKGPRVPTWINPIDGSEMVWIPPGPFVVGPQNVPAECAGFSLARHPVTNAQFAHFLEENNYRDVDARPFLAHWGGPQPPDERARHPVVFVSLIDALHYCRWACLALPTEWLWEKAARGPEGRRFPWGEVGPKLFKEWLCNVNTAGTCPVGSFPRTRSVYGCEDMIGNVSEWCQPSDETNFGHMPPAWPEIPEAESRPGPYAPVRGSCYLRTAVPGMVASHRRRLSLWRHNYWTGFRPACLLPYRPAI